MDWDEMVDRHAAIVWRAAGRLLGHGHEAADCFQDTFLAAFELSRRQEVENWAGMLAKIATANALNRLRKRYRQPVRPLESAAAVAMSVPPPGSAIEAQELADRLIAGLVELPEAQAQVFCLHCFEDQPHEQIAAALGIEPGNVRVLLHRARAKLKEVLQYQPRA